MKQSAWQNIIDKIQFDLGIENKEDWKSNDPRFNKLSINITNTVSSLVSKNPHLALYLEDKTDFKGKEEQDIVNIIKKGKFYDHYKVDARTLEKYFTKDITPTHKRKKNILSLFAFNLPFDELKQEGEETSNPMQYKLKQFYNTHWWLYFYEYDDNKRTGCLGKAVLIIHDEKIKGKVFSTIENVNKETATHYEGTVEVDNTKQHLFFDFTSLDINEKHLRICVFVGNGKCFPLAVGTYMNITSQNTMPAGTVVMEQVTDINKISTMKPELMDFEKAIESNVNKNIIDYLYEREKNYIKAPQGILAISHLERWLEDKRHIKNSTKK